MIKDMLEFTKLAMAIQLYGNAHRENAYYNHEGTDYIKVVGSLHTSMSTLGESQNVLDHRVHGTLVNKLVRLGIVKKVEDNNSYIRRVYILIKEEDIKQLVKNYMSGFNTVNPFENKSLRGTDHNLRHTDLEMIPVAELAWLWKKQKELVFRTDIVSNAHSYFEPHSHRIVRVMLKTHKRKESNFRLLSSIKVRPEYYLDVIGAGYTKKIVEDRGIRTDQLYRCLNKNTIPESLDNLRNHLNKITKERKRLKDEMDLSRAAIRDLGMLSEKRIEERMTEKACEWVSVQDRYIQEFCKKVLEGE